MSSPGSMLPIPLPAPVAGMNRRDPLPAMNPLYAPWIVNFEPLAQYLRARNGFVIERTIASRTIIGLGVHGATKLYAFVQGGGGNNYVVDVSDGSTDFTTASSGPDECTFHTFKNYVFIGVAQTSGGAYFTTGGAWADFAFTYSGTPVPAMHMTDFKGRWYGGYTDYLWWGALGAISGALSRVSVAELFRYDTSIAWMGVLTSPGDRADEAYFAFGNQDGEVLIYAGDNPDANNWQQVGRFFVGKLFYAKVSNKSTLEIKNDIWILSSTGIHSVRKLFQYGSDQSQTTVSEAIDPYWIELTQKYATAYGWGYYQPSIAYWPERNQVYVLCHGFLDNDGTLLDPKDYSTLFVYNFDSNAWMIYKLPIGIARASGATRFPSGFLTYFSNNIYFVDGTGDNIYKLGTGYKDEVSATPGTYQAFELELESAFTNLNNSSRDKRIRSFEPIIKTDFASAKITMKAAADFGRFTSAAQGATLIDGFQIPTYLVGAEGTYLQWQIDGDSDVASTDGFELYSVGVNL